MTVRIPHGKGDKARQVPLSLQLFEQLRTYYRSLPRRSGWMFPRTAKTAPPRLFTGTRLRPLGRAAACPARRVRKVLRWPLLSNEFGIRREQPLQVAFDIPPVSEWNLIETTNQKLQSADLYPSGFTARSLYSGYTFDCNRGISRLACTWISPTPWDRLSPSRTAGLFATFGVSSRGASVIHLRLRRGHPRRPSEGPIA